MSTALAPVAAPSVSLGAACVLRLVRPNEPARAATRGPVPVTRIASTEAVDIDEWARHMAGILLRRAGYAA